MSITETLYISFFALNKKLISIKSGDIVSNKGISIHIDYVWYNMKLKNKGCDNYMKLKIFTVTLLATIVLASCGKESINEDSSKENRTENIKELVSEYSTRNLKAEAASITSKQLIVTESDGSESVYDLPKNDFFVSIAPFINETHPCKNHSLTGCQGELAEEDFDVYIEDMDGNMIIDKTLKSQSNGFIDLWLPRI